MIWNSIWPVSVRLLLNYRNYIIQQVIIAMKFILVLLGVCVFYANVNGNPIAENGI